MGDKINERKDVQEFVERMLSYAFDRLDSDDDFMEEICDDMGITSDEVYWYFEHLGYTKEED